MCEERGRERGPEGGEENVRRERGEEKRDGAGRREKSGERLERGKSVRIDGVERQKMEKEVREEDEERE